ncbi:unnamed protein product [Sphagnum balticum]
MKALIVALIASLSAPAFAYTQQCYSDSDSDYFVELDLNGLIVNKATLRNPDSGVQVPWVTNEVGMNEYAVANENTSFQLNIDITGQVKSLEVIGAYPPGNYECSTPSL